MLTHPYLHSRSCWLLLLCVVALSASLRAQEFVPSDPTVCDAVTLVVERTFAEDCNWTVRPEVRIERDLIDVKLELLAGGDLCRQNAPTLRFDIDLGRLPVGEYVVLLSWLDLDEVPRRLPLRVEAAVCELDGYSPGDTNADGSFDIADPIDLLSHLFLGGELACEAAADLDESASLQLTDAVVALSYLFLGGDAPRPDPESCVSVRGSAFSCAEPQCSAEGAAPIWLSRPDGCFQCQPCDAPGLEAAVEALVDQGIDVLEFRLVSVPVCLACFVCSSGIDYAVLVPAFQAERLRADGWNILEGEPPR